MVKWNGEFATWVNDTGKGTNGQEKEYKGTDWRQRKVSHRLDGTAEGYRRTDYITTNRYEGLKIGQDNRTDQTRDQMEKVHNQTIERNEKEEDPVKTRASHGWLNKTRTNQYNDLLVEDWEIKDNTAKTRYRYRYEDRYNNEYRNERHEK